MRKAFFATRCLIRKGEKIMEINVSTVTWVLIATALIYFMQAGFALCEAGLSRA